MAVLATDAFTRADDSKLSDNANWSVVTGEANGIAVTSNAAAVTGTTGADSAFYYDGGVTWPADQYAQANLTVTSVAAGTGPALIVRAATCATTYYRAVFNHSLGSDNLTLTAIGVGNVTGYPRAMTFSDGDCCCLKVIGTTFKVFVNGVQVGADATDSNYATGKPGLGISTNIVTGSIDNFEGGTSRRVGRPPGARSWPTATIN